MGFEGMQNSVEKDPRVEAREKLTKSFDKWVTNAQNIDEVLNAFAVSKGFWEALDGEGEPEYYDEDYGATLTLGDYDKNVALSYVSAVAAGDAQRIASFSDAGIPAIVKRRIKELESGA